ncbi:hypothetical protein AB0J80_32625 [Actinoplanes sp. NPDC049548]|uniref:hypothetical protein n=1 Tax=Actinoplanes sp. NPDC049548 TaxID=3155152 RepID=UPI00342BD162
MQGPTSPPDWPEPDAPRPEEEPTVELPVVTGAPPLARAALSLALTRREPPSEPAPPEPPPPLPEKPRPVETPPPPAAAEPGRRWLVGAAIAAAALILTGVTVVALGRDRDEPDGRQWTPPAAAGGSAPSTDPAPAPAGHTATGARDGRTAAALDLIDGARTISLRTSDLGDDLYRISTPAGEPRADEQAGRIRVRLDGRPDAVDVALSTRVRWDLRISGGADLSTINLTGGRVGGVDLTGGASRIDLTLPEPDGTLSVRMSGGASLLDVRTAGSAPVRVRVGSGASEVVLDGRTHRGVAAGRTFTPRSWDATTDRVDVETVAGLSALTVAPTGG